MQGRWIDDGTRWLLPPDVGNADHFAALLVEQLNGIDTSEGAGRDFISKDR